MARKPTSAASSRKRIRPLFIIFGVIGLLIVIPALWFKYEDARMKNIVRSIPIPSEWNLVDSSFGGNRICTDSCRSYSETYRVSVSNIDVIPNLTEWVSIAGYIIVESNSDCSNDKPCFAKGRAGGLELVISQKNAFNNTPLDLDNGNTQFINIFVDRDSHIFGLFRE